MTTTLPVGPSLEETAYEKNQRYNALTRWLHGFRYRNMAEILTKMSAEVGGRPLRILEIGCATAKFYGTFDPRFSMEYTGIELDSEFCKAAIARYGGRPNFTVVEGSAADPLLYRDLPQPDLVVALETLEHIPERYVFRVIENIAALRPRRFIASVPVEVGPSIWIKNVGSLLVGYNRHKSRTWTEVFWSGLYAMNRLPVHSTGHRGFDWRWLSHTIRHYMQIREIRKSPFQWIPSPFAMSVMFVAEPRN